MMMVLMIVDDDGFDDYDNHDDAAYVFITADIDDGEKDDVNVDDDDIRDDDALSFIHLR